MDTNTGEQYLGREREKMSKGRWGGGCSCPHFILSPEKSE